MLKFQVFVLNWCNFKEVLPLVYVTFKIAKKSRRLFKYLPLQKLKRLSVSNFNNLNYEMNLDRKIVKV